MHNTMFLISKNCNCGRVTTITINKFRKFVFYIKNKYFEIKNKGKTMCIYKLVYLCVPAFVRMNDCKVSTDIKNKTIDR